MEGVSINLVLEVLETTQQRRKRRLACVRRRSIFAQRQAHECFFFALVLSTVLLNLCLPSKSLWTKERSSYCQMSQATFLYICSVIQSFIEKEDTMIRNAIPVEQRVAFTLWFLAANTDYPTVGDLFGVSKPTICVITNEECATIVKNPGFQMEMT